MFLAEFRHWSSLGSFRDLLMSRTPGAIPECGELCKKGLNLPLDLDWV